MRSNYKRLGDYIHEINTRNVGLKATNLLGINIDKFFMPSVANVVGTDMSTYKIVKNEQFACNRMHVGRDYRLPIALSKSDEDFLISPAYDVFEIKNTKTLLPEFLMMWFSRKEFDRNAWFYTDADVRGGLDWEAFCDMTLPIPSPDKQREIVVEYNTILRRIDLNNQLIQKLEETAQAIYKQWFVDFEFPNENGEPYKSAGGEMVESELGDIPKGWDRIPLYSVARFINGAAFVEDDFTIDKQGLPIVKIAELKNGVDDKTDFTLRTLASKYRLANGDLLYSWSGNPETSLEVFKWLGGDAWINQHIFRLEFPEEWQNEIFTYHLLKQLKPVFIKLAEGKQTTGLGHVTVEDMKKILIPYPNRELMIKYERISSPLYDFDTTLRVQQKKLSDLLFVLLSKLATVTD